MDQIIFLAVVISIWCFPIMLQLADINKKLKEKINIEEQSKRYLSQILTRLETGNFKDSW
jgi:hypothetical protein